jgi:hypothetical protein
MEVRNTVYQKTVLQDAIDAALNIDRIKNYDCMDNMRDVFVEFICNCNYSILLKEQVEKSRYLENVARIQSSKIRMLYETINKLECILELKQ